MLEKMKAFWNSLDNNVVIHQRELLLGITACTLAGVLAGMLLSPKKTVTKPYTMLCMIVSRKLRAVCSAQATGMTIIAETKSKPTMRMDRATVSAVSSAKSKFKRSTGRPATLADFSSKVKYCSGR